MAEGVEHEAVANARHRLSLQKQAVGERHPEYATSLNQLALLLIMHGDPDGAEPLLRQALDIRKEHLGESHPDYATNLSSLAGLLWARGDLDGAEPLLRQALEIRWDVLGSGHPKSIASLNSLEQLLRAKQDWAGVEQLSTRDLSSGPPPQPAPVQTSVKQAPPAQPPAAPAASVVPPPPTPVVERPPSAPVEPQAPAPVAVSPVMAAAPRVDEPTGPASVAATSESVPNAGQPAVTDGPTRAELVEAHKRLTDEFSRVADRLAREAEQWKTGGSPPTLGLIEDLSACGRGFETLRGAVLHFSEGLGTGAASKPLTNLHELGHLLADLGEAEGRREQLEALRNQALGVLDRVLALRSSDGKPLAPLEDCQKKAGAHRVAIAEASSQDLPEEATGLAEGNHPFNALLTLVEGDGLSDDLWSTSLELVEAEFGKPLSVAVARSKVVSPSAG